jgi:hypothetical protein
MLRCHFRRFLVDDDAETLVVEHKQWSRREGRSALDADLS